MIFQHNIFAHHVWSSDTQDLFKKSFVINVLDGILWEVDVKKIIYELLLVIASKLIKFSSVRGIRSTKARGEKGARVPRRAWNYYPTHPKPFLGQLNKKLGSN